MTVSTEFLAGSIEHTLLRAETTPDDIAKLCEEAIQFGFAGVCVNPIHVRQVADTLARHHTRIGTKSTAAIVTVVGFPLGASHTEIKAVEARRALDDGATEIDMVVQLGALVAGDRKTVRQDIEALARVVHGTGQDRILKVILETASLTAEQIILGCRCAAEGEADYVKTSTGFHPAGGATIEHVKLLHRYATPLRIKASGGIRSAAAARAMIEAGAVRIGTSSGVAMLRERK
jgi:deoxyribose-phosphate aldolase